MPEPYYLRVMMVLGDRDPDLREWCARNKRTRTAVMREALRAFLVRRGDLPAKGTGGTAAPLPRAAPTVPSKPSRTLATAGAARPASTPAPRPPQAPPLPAAHLRPAAPPPAAHPHQAQPPHDERSELRAMLGDFS